MDRYPHRREKLRAMLRSDDVDALLVSSPTNVSYLTGFSGDSSVLIVGRRAGPDRLGRAVHHATRAGMPGPGGPYSAARSGDERRHSLIFMESLGLKRVALEATSWTIADYETIRAAAPDGRHFVGVTGRVEALRQIKDDDEIAAIRQAIGYAERAFTMLRAGLRAGRKRKRRRRRARRLPAALRRHRGQLSADRRRGRSLGLAPRPPDSEQPGSARTILC